MSQDAVNPVLGVVLLPAEVCAELIVEGVADCKKVAPSAVQALAQAVLQRALRSEVVQVTGGAISNAAAVARAIAKVILSWDDEGHLPPNATINPGSKVTDVLHIDNFRALHPEAHAFATAEEAETHAAATGQVVWTLGEDWRVRAASIPRSATTARPSSRS